MNSNIDKVPQSGIRKFFDLVMDSEGVISLGVGEPDFATPWHIREEAIFSLEKDYTSYTSNAGLIELRELISEKLYKNAGCRYDFSKEILVTVGVSEAFDLALRALLNPGDEVIIPEPCFVSYKPLTIMNNAKPVIVDTGENNGFKALPEDIKNVASQKTKAIIINSPNNPTGAVLDKKTMEEIADLAVENDFYIISDEIYSDLVYERKHVSFSSLNGMKGRVISLNGFSKSYAMTGLRIGYAAGPEKIIKAMNKIHQYSIMCASITAQIAAIEALKNGDKEVDRMKEEYNRRRKVIIKGFNDIGLRCSVPNGAFYVFPNIASTKLSSERFCEELLLKGKVAAIPGCVFGKCGEGYIRCSYASSMEEINESIERIANFVGAIRKSNH